MVSSGAHCGTASGDFTFGLVLGSLVLAENPLVLFLALGIAYVLTRFVLPNQTFWPRVATIAGALIGVGGISAAAFWVRISLQGHHCWQF